MNTVATAKRALDTAIHYKEEIATILANAELIEFEEQASPANEVRYSLTRGGLTFKFSVHGTIKTLDLPETPTAKVQLKQVAYQYFSTQYEVLQKTLPLLFAVLESELIESIERFPSIGNRFTVTELLMSYASTIELPVIEAAVDRCGAAWESAHKAHSELRPLRSDFGYVPPPGGLVVRSRRKRFEAVAAVEQ